MFKSKRFLIAIIAGFFLACISLIATFLKLEMIAVAAVGGFMTVLTTYIFSEYKRPSVSK